MEKTVEGTKLSLPFETRFLKVGVKMLYKYVKIYLDSICTYIYYIHSSEGSTKICKVNMKETVTI